MSLPETDSVNLELEEYGQRPADRPTPTRLNRPAFSEFRMNNLCCFLRIGHKHILGIPL